jgi:hypothetical protein
MNCRILHVIETDCDFLHFLVIYTATRIKVSQTFHEVGLLLFECSEVHFYLRMRFLESPVKF